MSRRAIMVWLGVAAALALMALLTLRTPGADTGDGPLLDLRGRGVARIDVLRAGGARETLQREDGAWWLAVDSPGSSPVAWPVPGERVAAAVRVLSMTRVERDGSITRGDFDRGALLEIELEDGASATVRIGPRVLGGRVPVEVGEGDRLRSGRADAGVHALFGTGSLAAWRDDAVISRGWVDASRIVLRAGETVVGLARVEGKWWLTEPARAPADEAAVRRALGALAAVRVARFIDAPQEPSWLESPAGIARLERTRRVPVEGGSRARVEAVELLVGPAAAVAAPARLARVTWDPPPLPGTAGPLLVIDAAALEAIAAAPAAYVDRLPLRDRAPDAGRIVVESARGSWRRGWTRGLDGWTEDAEVPAPAQPADAESLGRLLALLSREPAASVAIARDRSGGGASARLHVESLAGAPIGSFDVAADDDPPTAIQLRASGVEWTWTSDAGRSAAAWLASLAPRD
jgi:hypothetical protein